jgi:acetyltransferase-like isoleucine patch superfamily enzyme
MLVHKVSRLCVGTYFRLIALRNGSWISLFATLDVEPGGRVVVGRGVRVIKGTIMTVARGATLRIGDGAWIGPYNVIYCAKAVTIGRGTRVSHFCSIVDNDYDFRAPEQYFHAPKTMEAISIGENAWLGAGCTVLKGVEIGSRCIIGANSLLRAGKIPDGSICYRPSDEGRLKFMGPT